MSLGTTLRLGTHSNGLQSVVQAFEKETGLPLSSSPDEAWLETVLTEYNKANNTNIAYSHENYGYYFSYSTPEEARLLGAVRTDYRLGGD